MKTFNEFVLESEREMKHVFSRKKDKKQKKDIDPALKAKEEIDTEPSIGSEIPGNNFT